MDNFDKQLILACKGWYGKGLSTIDILQRMWAIRCGYNFDCIDKWSLEHIATKLFKILSSVKSEELIIETIHSEISKTYLDRYKGLSPIEVLVLEYCSQIVWMKVDGLDLKVTKGLDEMILGEVEVNYNIFNNEKI